MNTIEAIITIMIIAWLLSVAPDISDPPNRRNITSPAILMRIITTIKDPKVSPAVNIPTQISSPAELSDNVKVFEFPGSRVNGGRII